MGILSSIFKGTARFADKRVSNTKDTARKVLGIEHAKSNYQFTKSMVDELRYHEDTETPRFKDYEDWKAQNRDVTEQTMRLVYARNCKAALMFFLMLLVSLGLIVNLFFSSSTLFHKILVFLPTLSFGVMMFTLYLRYALVAYQIKTKRFVSLPEFAKVSLSKGFPDIKFKLPADWKK